ncbi:hypothetical protein BH10PSE6_BH10PSE6_20870 [soil metagenome]
MQRRRPLAQFWLLPLALSVSFGAALCEGVNAQSPTSPAPPTDRPLPESPTSPGMQRAIGKPDTPEDRDAMLKRRQELDSNVKIDPVRPLPAQTITPNAAQRQ